MNCEEAKNQLYDYILGELDPSIEIQVNDHIAACTACRKELEQCEIFMNAIKKSPKLIPDQAVYKKILGAKSHSVGRKTPSTWKAPIGLVSAIAAFFLGVILMYGVNMLFINRHIEKRGTDILLEPARKTPFSDTVKFYYAPSKNLAQI